MYFSVYDYYGFARFLVEQDLSANNQNVWYGFLMLIKNSRTSMQAT